MVTYVIGDVQGCLTELQELLDLIHLADHDKLWFTGDLVNRGPNSLGVLRFLRSLPNKVVVVLGNHDIHLLARYYVNSPRKNRDTLEELLHAPDAEELCDWLRKQALLHYDPIFKFILVHAGLPPQWELSKTKHYAREVEEALKGENFKAFLLQIYGNTPEQWDDNLTGYDRLRFIVNALTRIRYCTTEGLLSFSEKGHPTQQSNPELLPWFKVPGRQTQYKRIVFGHWATLNGKTHTKNAYALDTGCVWGNTLTAMRIPDGRRYAVAANKKTRRQSSYLIAD